MDYTADVAMDPELSIDDGNDPYEYLEMTPLMLSAWVGHFECAKLLIDKGAKESFRSIEDFTPLDIACLQEHSKVMWELIIVGSGTKPEKQQQMYK